MSLDPKTSFPLNVLRIYLVNSIYDMIIVLRKLEKLMRSLQVNCPVDVGETQMWLDSSVRPGNQQ